MKKKILILCHDIIGQKMAGPGIRYHNIARVLEQQGHRVTLGTFSADNTINDSYLTIKTSGNTFEKHFDQCDLIFTQWLSTDMINYAQATGKAIIFDLYAPVPIEYLASLEFSDKPSPPEKDDEFQVILTMYDRFLRVGQFFTCSNERQRDFWIGYATASRILTPSTFLSSRMLDKFALCPMGIDSNAPNPKNLLLRSSIDGIAKTDFVLLWTGGIWDWFDAQLVVKSMSMIHDTTIKLVFLGTKHPNKNIDEMDESKKVRQLALSLGLLNKTVFFMDGWVPYENRASYFVDADAAIYADKESLETRFSHRTRVLDHIWTELPTICTSGDYLAEIIQREGFGIVIKDRNAEQLSKAILELRDNKILRTSIRENIKKEKYKYTWEETLTPLLNFVNQTDFKRLSGEIKKGVPSMPQPVKKSSFKRRVKLSAKTLLGR